jgi:NAD(P)-dependent dehydrogenase (short-subunit alcohol dehydrogenase family)
MHRIPGGPLWEIPPEHAAWLVQLNLLHHMYATHAAMPHLIRSTGRIVYIGSVSAFTFSPGKAPYVAAKAGLVALTRTVAKEAAPYGVRVNCVSPGTVRTRIWDHQLDGTTLETVLRATGQSRATEPSEVAELVAYLLSDAASRINAETIRIDAGVG